MKKCDISTFLKGLIVGGTMIIPGVSGGTMAMILGIYDKLIYAVSSFRRTPFENLRLLMTFVIGGLLGILLFSTPLSWLLENYEFPVIYFFVGAVVGGIPLIERKSGVRKISVPAILCMVIGTGTVLAISAIPTDVFNISKNPIILLFVGAIAAIALILPGISISHLFLVLGMYEEILRALKTLDLTILIPLAAGIGAGIILFSKILENLMGKYPGQTYLIILGFILGSVAGIFPGIPLGANEGMQLILCIGLLLTGFFTIFTLQNKSET